jgi:hypothetical protein
MMRREGEPSWSGDSLEHSFPPGTDVEMSVFKDPPFRTFPDGGMVYVMAAQGKRAPRGMGSWDVKERIGDDTPYVPMNSASRARFEGPGYLGTAHLNACTAVAACYRDDRKDVNAFLSHYDPENMRFTDEDGNMMISRQLAEFAGDRPVRVAFAFSKVHNPAPAPWETLHPEEHPIDVLLQDFAKLPAGSSVLLVPYETSTDFANPTTGHVLYVGCSGSGGVHFGWNDHTLQIGAPEEFSAERLRAARAFGESLPGRDDDDLDFMQA